MIYNKEFIGFENFNILFENNKKVFKNLPNDWNNTQKKVKITENKIKNTAIIAGKKNLITIFDFDLYASYISFTEKHPFLKDSLLIKTKKGYHIYVEYEKRFKSNTDVMKNFSKVDIINDNCFITAPNSFYYDQQGKKIVYQVIKEKDIIKLNDNQVNDILNDIKEDKSTSLSNTINKTSNNLIIEKIADLINLKYLDNYNDWIKIVFACASINKYDLSIKISQKSNKFNQKNHDSVYKKFNPLVNSPTEGTLHYYAQKSNLDEYIKLFPKLNFTENESELGDIYVQLRKDVIVIKGEDIYIYLLDRWIKDDKTTKEFIKQDIQNTLKPIIDKKIKGLKNKINGGDILGTCEEDFTKQKKALSEKLKKFEKICKKVSNNSGLNGIATLAIGNLKLKNYFLYEKIKFDEKPYLLPFNNCCYDLKNERWIELKKEDYISIYTGNDYKKPSDKQVQELMTFIKTILPDEEVRNYYLYILSTCMVGITLEKFICSTGGGRNGKGVIHELLGALLGNFYYQANPEILLTSMKSGGDPQIANMHKKRFVVYPEPDEKKKLIQSVIKVLTGGQQTNARKLFSNNTTCILNATNICEFNTAPKIDGKITEAIISRLQNIPFTQTFIKKEDWNDEFNENENYHLGDSYYKSNEFKDDYYCCLFEILKGYVNKSYKVPKIVNEMKEAHLQSSNEFYEWFNTRYEKGTLNKNKQGNYCIQTSQYILIKDVVEQFKQSSVFECMEKKDKREYNSTTKLKQYFETNNYTKYKVCDRKLNNITNENIRNFLFGYVLVENDDEDDEIEDKNNELDCMF